MNRLAHVVVALLAALIAPTLQVSSGAQTVPTRTVLTIHSGAETFPSNPLLDAGMRESLADAGMRVDYFAEYFESEEFPQEDVWVAFTEYLRLKYRGRHIDVVVAMTDRSLRFALRNRARLFPNAPIVFMGLDDPGDDVRRSGAGVTGVRVGVAYNDTLALALRLHPTTDHVFVVAKGTAGSTASARAQLSEFETRVTMTYLNAESVPSLIATVKTLPARSLVLFLWHDQQDRGQVLYSNEIVPDVAAAASVPVYGTSDLYLGTGVVGGVVRGTRETGRRLGALAARILAGTPARDIPVETARVLPLLDSRAMRRWSVNERLLPADAVVSFRPPSLWRDYRREVLLVLTGLAVQSLLIVGLLYQRSARQRAETESRRNLSMASDANRRAVTSALTGSIAHELSQPLNSMLHNAQAAEMLVASHRATPELLKEMLADICSENARATAIIERHRTMLRNRQMDKAPIDIHSVVRDTLDLVRHDMSTRQIRVDVRMPAHPCLVLGDRILLQQVLVNLMVNAGDAMGQTPRERRQIDVSSQVDRHRVSISVRDAGTGLPSALEGRLFEPFATTKTRGIGIGLTIARNIVEAHNGSIDGTTNPDGGATFTVTLPRLGVA